MFKFKNHYLMGKSLKSLTKSTGPFLWPPAPNLCSFILCLSTLRPTNFISSGYNWTNFRSHCLAYELLKTMVSKLYVLFHLLIIMRVMIDTTHWVQSTYQATLCNITWEFPNQVLWSPWDYYHYFKTGKISFWEIKQYARDHTDNC